MLAVALGIGAVAQAQVKPASERPLDELITARAAQKLAAKKGQSPVSHLPVQQQLPSGRALPKSVNEAREKPQHPSSVTAGLPVAEKRKRVPSNSKEPLSSIRGHRPKGRSVIVQH